MSYRFFILPSVILLLSVLFIVSKPINTVDLNRPIFIKEFIIPNNEYLIKPNVYHLRNKRKFNT